MESLSSLFNKEHVGELILSILFIIYLVLGFHTPQPVANLIDTLVGKLVILLIVLYLFLHSHPILAVLALFVAFDLMRRSTSAYSSGPLALGPLQPYAPSEESKQSVFSATHQFPYTLEQEVVKKMAPILRTGSSMTAASYKPMLVSDHDASPLN